MAFKKIWGMEFPVCYVASAVRYDGMDCPVFATEAPGPAYLLTNKDFEKKLLWSEPGGSMGVVAVPGRDGEFMAIQKFFPGFQSHEAQVVWGRPDGGGWITDVVLKIPFVHRIEFISKRGVNYLIISQLCAWKDFKRDWSYPGAVYAAVIDYEKRTLGEPKLIQEGLSQNHGLLKTVLNGRECLLTASQKGVWALYPPETPQEDWEQACLIENQSSDMAIADIDNDGEPELGVISSFHGDEFSVYKKLDGVWTKIYDLEGTHSVAHAIWGGIFQEVPTFFVGFRQGEQGLFLVRYGKEKKALYTEQIASGIGPNNCAVLHRADGDILLAANRETNHCAIYRECQNN